jgi:hypothetical protein
MRHVLTGLAALALATILVDGCSGSNGGNGVPGPDGGEDSSVGSESGTDASSPVDGRGEDASPGVDDGGADSMMGSGVDAGDAAPVDASVDDGSTSSNSDASDASDATTPPADASDGDTNEADANDASSNAVDSGLLDATADAADADAAADAATADAGPPGVLLLVGTSSSQLLEGQFTPGLGWSTATVAAGSSFSPSLTADSAGNGVAVYTSSTGGVVSSTIWAGGAWSTPAAVGASAISRGQPFVDATGGSTTHLIYQDTSYDYWYLAFTGSWSASPQAVGTAGNQDYGPVPATIAALGANATAAFIDGEGPSVNYAAAGDLVAGVWQARTDLTGPESYTVSSVIVPLGAGPELMMVFVQQNAQVMFQTRSAGVWSAAAAISNALTNDTVALAPLPGGGAILGFEGQDTNLYWAEYSGGSWSAVAAFATPNVSIAGSPAVTHGIGGDTAEVAYVSGGAAYHARLTGGAWTAPVAIGGTALVGVAIAAIP